MERGKKSILFYKFLTFQQNLFLNRFCWFSSHVRGIVFFTETQLKFDQFFIVKAEKSIQSFKKQAKKHIKLWKALKSVFMKKFKWSRGWKFNQSEQQSELCWCGFFRYHLFICGRKSGNFSQAVISIVDNVGFMKRHLVITHKYRMDLDVGAFFVCDCSWVQLERQQISKFFRSSSKLSQQSQPFRRSTEHLSSDESRVLDRNWREHRFFGWNHRSQRVQELNFSNVGRNSFPDN